MAWESLINEERKKVLVTDGITITLMWPDMWQCIINHPRYRFAYQGKTPLEALEGAIADMIAFHETMATNLEHLANVREQCNEDAAFASQSSG